MRIPKLCRHRATDRAYLTNPSTGKEIYFGSWSDPEAHRAYAQWCAQFAAQLRSHRRGVRVRTLGQLMDEYRSHADKRYRRLRGEPASQLKRVTTMCRRLEQLGLDKLRLVDLSRRDILDYRESYRGSTREYQNKTVATLLLMLRYAEQRDWIQSEQLAHLERIEPLSARDAAGESEVEPVSVRTLWLYYKAMGRLAPLFALHCYLACRVENACAVRWEDIDRSSVPWIYRPRQHKGAWRGAELVIRIGPRARSILEQCGKKTGYAFPAPSGHVRNNTYLRAITAARQAHNLPHLTPRQVRHSSASYLLRRGVPLHIISAILGHSPRSAGITGRYAVADERDVCAVVERYG